MRTVMPFLPLNHSGSAFFSISWMECKLNHDAHEGSGTNLSSFSSGLLAV